MRTTLNLDDDVLDRARALSRRGPLPFRQVVNEALRQGLSALEESAQGREYKTKPHELGLLAGRDIDNVQELLAQVEGETQR